MSHPAYLVTHPRNGYAGLERSLSAKLKRTRGSALVPISMSRSVLPAVCANEIARAGPGSALAERLRKLGATGLRPLGSRELMELLAWREPAELPQRPKAMNQKRVTASHDWHLGETGLDRAWTHWGGPGQISWGGVVVGHIDTGFTGHPCLGWQGGASPFVLTDRDRNFFYDELYPGPESGAPHPDADPHSAEDPLTGAFAGHGTRTASVLAGYAPADNFFGAAPRVPHVPIRISNSVWINNVMEGLADALAYLIDEVNCPVITMSMGAALPAYVPPRVRREIDRAYERGIIYVCAAGNVIESVVAPARNPRTIGVGGTTLGGHPWSGSSHGRYVDVCAPADLVRRGTVTRARKFEYGLGDGTSFATQMVGGAAALWVAKHGPTTLHQAYPERWQRTAAFLKLLKETARVPPGWDSSQYGAGILQADALLGAPLPAADTLIKDLEPH